MNTLGFIWAGLAVGLGGIGAGFWEAMIAASAMNAILRNPDLKGKLMTFMILFIALDETVAIYGLIVALQILWIDASSMTNPHMLIAAGLAVGLPWIAVWIGEWRVAKTSVENMWKNPELSSTFMVLTILGMALVESAAIYWLVVAFDLIGA